MSTATAEPATAPATEPAKPFTWSEHIHLGDGAEDCPDNGAGCTDTNHFHVWLRVANPFVRDTLREQAMAARARRLRLFRDPESDSSLVLEGELDELRQEAERADSTETLIDRVLLKDWGRRHLEAMKEATEDEDFEHIDADRERFAELADLPDAECPTEEFDALDQTIIAYGERVEELRKQAEAPVRESLTHKTIDELLALIREDRIAAEGNTAFFDTWLRSNIVAGTYYPEPDGKRPTRPRFENVAALAQLGVEEAEALRAAFVTLESGFQAGLGNS